MPEAGPSATTSYILGTAQSCLLQEAFSIDFMQGFGQIFSDPGMEWESRHPLVFMCRRYLNCAVYDSSGLLMQSMFPRPHRSMWQRLSCQRGILVVNRDHEKVWGGLRVTGGMPSREVVKSSFLLSLSLSPCRRRVTVYSLRHKCAIMMIHHWPGTRANQMS